jgi:hypothetical protein
MVKESASGAVNISKVKLVKSVVLYLVTVASLTAVVSI